MAQVAREFMSDGVTGCEALVWALLSVAPDVPNAEDLIHRAAVAVKCIAKEPSLRYGTSALSLIPTDNSTKFLTQNESINEPYGQE